MGTDNSEVVEPLPNPHSFKVHRTMCTELTRLVDQVSRIFPNIEASRPRCSTGIQALCLLNSAIDKAKLLLQHCCECSKLYLAVTGDVIQSRCLKARKLLEQSLGQIQDMVPVMLGAEISQIIDDLSCAKFVLDSVEDEAGRVVRELLQQGTSMSDSMENSEVIALQFAAARLNITSAKAILIEKRSIKKLMDKEGPNDSTKKMILRYLLYLLKKYGNSIMGEQMENAYACSDGPIATENLSHNSLRSHDVKSDPCLNHGQYGTHHNELSRVIPPEEYKCPISSKVMYDPVVIASGVTYERMWIQKWFDEGKDTCPKTGKKLGHMSLTPNIAMKDLISKWGANNGVVIPDPSTRTEVFRSWEASSTSIMSFGSSMNDLHLPVDLSSMSLGSLDASYNSDSSQARTTRGSNLMLTKNGDDSHSHQTQAHIHDTDLMLLSKLPDLEWDSQCQVIEDLKKSLKSNYLAFNSVSSESFIEPVIRFLSFASRLNDVKALRGGTQLLLEFVSNCRNGLTNLTEDTFRMLSTFLESEEVKREALAILVELSGYQHDKATIVASSALTSILKILDSEGRELQEKAISILYNLSFNVEICLPMVSLECIPKLVPFLKDRALVRHAVCVLKNLSDTEEGRVSIAETEGCMSCVADILENGSKEEQEHALAVLLSLCSQRMDYCQLTIGEGVIPSLVFITNNGTDKAKAIAVELLRLLRDVVSEYEESPEPKFEAPQNSNNQSREKKSSKSSGLLKKLSVFSKHKRRD